MAPRSPAGDGRGRLEKCRHAPGGEDSRGDRPRMGASGRNAAGNRFLGSCSGGGPARNSNPSHHSDDCHARAPSWSHRFQSCDLKRLTSHRCGLPRCDAGSNSGSGHLARPSHIETADSCPHGHLYLAVEAESGGFDAPGGRTDEDNGAGGELAHDVQRLFTGGERHERALKASRNASLPTNFPKVGPLAFSVVRSPCP